MPDFDPRWVFLVLVFAAVMTAAQALLGLVRTAGTRRKVNKRLAVVERTGSLAELVLELRKQRGLSESGDSRIMMRWLSDMVARSGVPYQPRRWALYVIGLAATVFLLLFVWTRSPLIALAVAPAVSIALPLAFLHFKAEARAKAIATQLPNALEIIVRSLEAGHPVPTAVALVGREMPDPLGSEFGMAADEIAYGATLEQAVGRIADRCRHPDVDLFAATIRLQERSGGNLTGLLKMNAKAVRERAKMRMKIKAASSEGRASAMILTGAPFGVLGILTVSAPHFYGAVIHATPVKIGLVVLGVWMFIGNLVMRRMIDMRI
ncbi:type II secretion system F family protein [Caulobacter mirabilis]|uniref:Pilus assembly protein TadB n=1 Tax=Caulobacter mirabilis TaxID=69666 RepID=A0A2D2B2T7_9CAUL|nr:type II secretion system F family protein [Caulobacter mirabilis]ATQ44548.1 pilus assembly protein TadB [Caulobacter mirabilis]